MSSPTPVQVYLARVRANVPKQLLALPVWLTWALVVDKPGEKPKKWPYYADGSSRRGTLDSPEDRARLVDFETAARALEALGPNAARDGLGIALGEIPGEEIHLAGMDFDHVDRNGVLDARVREILTAAASYAEKSPSGDGVHILGTGVTGSTKKDERGLEIYDGRRFFTVTGDVINTAGIADITEAAQRARQLFSVSAPPAKVNGADRGAGVAEGGRNSFLSREAYRLRKAGSTVEQIAIVLRAMNEAQCSPPLPEEEVLQIARGKERIDPEVSPVHHEESLADVRSTRFRSLRDVGTAVAAAKVPLVRELLYPGAWLVVGRPKIGKSWLLLQLTLAVAECGTFLGFNCTAEAVEVLTIFGEDDDARIQSRLAALGVATVPSNVYSINQQDLYALAKRFATDFTFAEFLDVWLSEHPKVRLVVIDTETTVRQVWAGERGQDSILRVTETDYKQTRTFDELALRRKLVVLLVNHASKRKGEWTDIHELINRSNTALAGASGSIALADPPDADPFDPRQKTRVLGIRGRDLKEDVLLAVSQEKDLPIFTSQGEYAEVRQTQVEQQLLEALEELQVEAGSDEYVGTDDLAAAVSKGRGTVKRAMARMLSKGRGRWKKSRVIVKRGKGGGYRLEAPES